MNKSLIKAYAMTLTPDKVKEFANKEGISISDEEANLFISTIRDNADYILDGHAEEVIESKKSMMSENAYYKLLELFNKYKKFID
jgi:hypothetical protein